MRRLCVRLPWLTVTPAGTPVEPDVYCRYAGQSGDGGGLSNVCSIASPDLCLPPTSDDHPVIQWIFDSAGAVSSFLTSRRYTSDVVTATVAPQSLASAASVSSVWLPRGTAA